MTKSDYLSSSAKYFAFGSVLLFVVNLMYYISTLSAFLQGRMGQTAAQLQTIALYVFPVIAFIALSGEGVGQKKGGNRAAKKKIKYFKWFLLFTFLWIFPKNMITAHVLKLSVSSFGGVLLRYITSLLFAVFSYPFFLLVIAAWYMVRDKGYRRLQLFEKITLGFSAAFFVFKVLNYSAVTYGVKLVPTFLETLFASVWPIRILCLLQFVLDIVMFAVVRERYLITAGEEEAVIKKEAANTARAFTLPLGEGFGIDEQDDLWYGGLNHN